MAATVSERLNLILEDGPIVLGDDVYQNIRTIATELADTKQRIGELEQQLAHAVDRLCGGLAMGIRRRQPGLNVALGNGCCKVNYLTKSLTFRPDLAKQLWMVETSHPKFGSLFRRRNGHLLPLNNSLNGLAGGVADFFTNFYRSIHEDIRGLGHLQVRGRDISMSGLAVLVEQKDQLLRPRGEPW